MFTYNSHLQRDRRNLTDGDVLHLVQKKDGVTAKEEPATVEANSTVSTDSDDGKHDAEAETRLKPHDALTPDPLPQAADDGETPLSVLPGDTPVEKESHIETVEACDLKTAEPFCSLLPIDGEVLARIISEMREHGYDPAQPVVVWDRKDVVVDGHTRLRAARDAGISDVPVVRRSFDDENSAVRYALLAQRNRRNLTEAQILELVEKLDKRWPHGGDRRSEVARIKASGDVLKGKSSERTGELIGMSASKVERARRVLNSDDEKLIASVRDGTDSINSAAGKIRFAACDRKTDPNKAMSKSTAAKASEAEELPLVSSEFFEGIELIRKGAKLIEPGCPHVAGEITQIIEGLITAHDAA